MDLGEEFGRAARAFQAGDIRTAERICGKILRKAPRHIGALSLLATIELRGGDLDAGIRHTRAVLKLNPDDVDALFNLGHALTLQHHLADALDCYDKVLALRPDHAPALGNRGAILLLFDRAEEALASFQKAVLLEPNWLAAAINVGLALVQLKRHEEALAAFEQALSRDPNNELLLFAKGGVLEELNRTDDAIATYQQILSKNPNLAKARFALCKAQLPVLYRDASEIAARRAAYARCLDALAADVSLTANSAQAVEIKPPYYLAYQGENDRDLQSTYGALACSIAAASFPQQVPKRPRPKSGRPLKIGVVSGFFRQHSVWKIPTKGLLDLDRKRFRLFGYHTGQSADAQTEIAKGACERFVQGLSSIEAWRKAIMNDAPDVLIYPEIGMDPFAAQLAAQRLAPVQCNYAGHPTTSGFPTLDYFLSSDLMEPDNGQQHYSERLVRLPNLGFVYEPATGAPPSNPQTAPELPPAACRFWCGQSTFKYLPQYDQVFPRIAQQAGNCQFVFIASQVSARVTSLFHERVSRAFSDAGLDAARHCVFLPRMSESEFGAVQARSDMLLDSIGWSGNNSTLESLAYNIPIVTLPGALMRGRHSMAILKMMGVASTIAATIDEYIDIAVHLARDPSAREKIKAQIAANKSKIYGDRSVVTALESFLETAAQTD